MNPRPSQSSLLALGADDAFLVNVNPDVNTITIFLTTGLNKIAELAVGKEPNSVAIDFLHAIAYVANSQDGTISVVDLAARQVLRTFSVGVEPMAVALSPNGTRLYVANSASNNVMVVDTSTETIVATVDLSPQGTSPRAIAVTNDGDGDDTDETSS